MSNTGSYPLWLSNYSEVLPSLVWRAVLCVQGLPWSGWRWDWACTLHREEVIDQQGEEED